MDTGDKSDRDLLVEIRSDVKHLRESKDDHETRLRVMEQNAWKQSGAIGLATFLASAFIAWLISVFKDGKH